MQHLGEYGKYPEIWEIREYGEYGDTCIFPQSATPQLLARLFRQTEIFLTKPGRVFYVCSERHNGDRPLSEPVEPTPPAPRRDRSSAARSAARQERAEREARIVSLLNRGFSVAEIADRNGVSERAMRKSIRTLLARRAPAPPAEFLALQVSRLNEALLVAYGAMSPVNLEAVDRVVKIVRELDRYHGFAIATGVAMTQPPRLPPPSAAPLVLEAPGARREPIGAATD
jgi:DNA-binding CsgD family transcriptional regulator